MRQKNISHFQLVNHSQCGCYFVSELVSQFGILTILV